MAPVRPTPLFSSANLLRWSAPLLAALTAGLGVVVLAGWVFGLESIKRIQPQFVAMNPLSAIAFLLAGCTLWLVADGSAEGHDFSTRDRRIVCALAALIAFIGLARVSGVLGGPDIHLDQWLFRSQLDTPDPGSATHAVISNRMAPNTALFFLATGLALAGFSMPQRWPRIAGKIIALLTTLAAVLAAIGYLNGVTTLYRPTAMIPIALHSAFGFIFVSLGILAVPSRATAALAARDLQERTAYAVEKQITVGFGAALFVLAIIGVVSYASIQNFAAVSALNERSSQIVAAVAEFTGLMTDAETGVRGFAITGNPTFLEPFEKARSATPGQLATLKELTRDNISQEQQMQSLLPLVDAHLGSLETTVNLRTSDGEQAAENRIAGGAGKSIMDSIRTVMAAMRDNEDRLQARRSEEMRASNRLTTFVITSGSLLAFALVGFSGFQIRRDLRNKRLLDAQLRQAQRVAEHANESKSQFLANMSHEIRTPMTAIIGFADLILDPAQNASDRLDYVNTIRRNGEHLLMIINDVLDLSKIEAGKFQIEAVDCCPCQVLSDVASLMRVRAVEKLIRLEVKNEGLVPASVRTDPSRLRQILINLVGNAIKFTDEGWVRVIMRLEVPEPDAASRLTPPKSFLRFDVIDTGIGMTREQVGLLFQPFQQADGSTTRRFGGTGLGLTISKHLAGMLGGDIDVDSSPGRGSTFTVRIDPGSLAGVARWKNCKEALAGTGPRTSEKFHGSLRGRILLVDDGADNRRLLSVYLREAGAEVALAENGRIGCDEALAAAAHGEPHDVILMDMQMPELDGYGAAARLRSKGYTGTIIALTAHAMADDRAKCLNAGCTDYLSKPVRRDLLLATVAKYLPGFRNSPAAPLHANHAPEITLLESFSTAPPSAQAGVIRSDLQEASLQPMLRSYVEDLPARVDEMESNLARADLEALSSAAHNLHGTGGLFGLMPITRAAGRLEEALKNRAAMESIHAQVQELLDILRRVDGYTGARALHEAKQNAPRPSP